MGHTSFQLNRRAFLGKGLLAGGALALGPAFYERAFAHGPVSVGPGPYGPLQPFNADGIALPPGFSSREIARGGQLVSGTSYTWHFATDGQATFPTRKPDGGPDGGWILVANSEIPLAAAGGASAIEFAPDGKIEKAYRILERTQQNCAGGPTPWGTWLSCEEHDRGRVWECDPTGATPVNPRPAMGIFSHEAACVDPVREQVYLTEDEPDGCLYRFTPKHYPDLSAGLLELAAPDGEGKVRWIAVPDPSGGSIPTRKQRPEAAHFDGGEGTWYDEGIVYFTTKGDERVWTYHVADQALHVMYDPKAVGPDAPLSGVDNITVSPAGEVYVCEDGRDHDICLITPDFQVRRFLKLDPVMHSGPAEPSPVAGNECVGVIFSPDGSRMYFGAQRSFADGGLPRGVVYEVTGPFTKPPAPMASLRDTRPPTTLLGVRPRIRLSELSRAGLPFRLGLDELASVDAWLRVPKARGRGVRTIARFSSPVALRGNVLLRLKPGKAARRALAGRRSARAVLTIRAIDAAGNRRVVRRSVRIVRRG